MDIKNRTVIIGGSVINLKRVDKSTCKNCMYGYSTNPNEEHWCKFIRDPRNFDEKTSSFFKFCGESGLVATYEIPEDGALDNFPHDVNVEIPKLGKTIDLAIQEYCKNFCLLKCTEICPLKPYKQ